MTVRVKNLEEKIGAWLREGVIENKEKKNLSFCQIMTRAAKIRIKIKIAALN